MGNQIIIQFYSKNIKCLLNNKSAQFLPRCSPFKLELIKLLSTAHGKKNDSVYCTELIRWLGKDGGSNAWQDPKLRIYLPEELESTETRPDLCWQKQQIYRRGDQFASVSMYFWFRFPLLEEDGLDYIHILWNKNIEDNND